MSADLCLALERVRERIASACFRAGRAPGEVRVVAVTKTVPAERVRALYACGHDLFGENRVQEAAAKIPEVGPGARWHLVGHLQRNKARHAVRLFELIHSLDAVGLAQELARRAAALGKRQRVLVQVNVAREATKQGVSEEALPELVEAILGLEALELRGLMTIPPPPEIAEDSRRWFARLRELRDRTAERFGVALPELSMGMSDDLEVAVEEGATLVRLGRALFGERPPA